MVLSAIEINPAGIFLSLKKLYKFIAQAVVRVSALSWKGHGFDLSQGSAPGLQFVPWPWLGPLWEATDPCLSLSQCLLHSLKISGNNNLG